MGIWDRLGDLIKGYLNEEDAKIFGRTGGGGPSGAPDLDAAFEELNEFLSGPAGGAAKGDFTGGGGFTGGARAWGERGFPGGPGGKPRGPALRRAGGPGGSSRRKSGGPSPNWGLNRGPRRRTVRL
jgi:hypothetical protein